VNWGETKLFYHYSAMKIQYVYLVFTSVADAQKVYSERHIYELKLGKLKKCLTFTPKTLKIIIFFVSFENSRKI